MNAMMNREIGICVVVAALLGGAGAAFAQADAENDAAAGTNETTEAGSATNATAEAGAESSANETAPAGTDETATTAKKETVYRGKDMQEAFKGTGRSPFGISGRVNKMPAKKSAKAEKGAWKRVVEAGVSTASGNSDVLRYDGSVSAAKETEENYFFLETAGRYGESDNETDAANAMGEGKVQHRLSERVYAALDVNARHDQIADLSYRLRSSLSLGRRFIWSERTALSAELGPGYVAEKKGGEMEGFSAGRAAQYLEILVADNLQLWQAAEWVQNLEDSAVYFVNAEIGLEVVLAGNMNLCFAVEDTYDSQPAAGKESNDVTTKTTLVWKF